MPVDPHEPRGTAHSAPVKKRKPASTPDVVFGPTSGFGAKVTHAKTVDTTKSHPSIDHPAAAAPAVKADAGVVSRQRFLRAKGYHVVVDGIDGPATRAAWAAYQQSLNASAPVQANVQQRREQQAAQTKQAVQQRTKIAAQERAAQVVAQTKAKSADLADQARKTATIVTEQRKVQAELKKAGKLLPSHGSPERFDVGQAFTHEAAPLSAVVLQTRKALAFAATARKKSPEHLTPAELVAITVDPITGSLDPQKPAEVRIVQRYLRAHGHPTIALDGVWGRQTFDALKTAMNQAKVEEEAKQRQEIIDTFYKPGIVKPGAKGFPVLGTAPKPGELLRILQTPAAAFSAGVILKELLRRAYQGDAGWQHFREQQLLHLEVSVGRRMMLDKNHSFDVFSNPLIHRDFQQRLTDIQAGAAATLDPLVAEQFIREVGALGSARNVDDLGRRLKTVQRQSEAHFREAMQARSKNTSWWRDGLDAIGKPSEWVATAAENTYEAVIEVGSHGARADQAAVQQRTIDLQKNHPWVNLGLQMALDPLWLTGGLPAAGLRAGAQFALRMERLGYAVEEGGRLVPVAVRVAAAESLKLPASAGRALAATHVALKAGTESDPVLRLTQIDHVYNFAIKATAMKRDAVALARANVRHAMYHGFAKVENVPFFPVPASIRQRIADTELNATAAHLQLTPRLMKLLVQNRQSLFATVDAKPHDFTQYGAMLYGRLAAGIRTNEVQRYALKVAKDESDHVLETTGDIAAAKLAQQQAYDDIIRRAGNYHVGNVPKELGDILDGRVKRQLDLLDTQMRVMQRHLVSQSEARSRVALAAGGTDTGLFDETGRFAGRFGQDDETFRMFGRDIYDEEARVEQHNYLHADDEGNPVFHRVDEVSEYKADELGRYVTRVKGYAARRSLAGKSLPQAWADAKINEKVAELDDAWQRTSDGWVDIRETLSVPAVYLRHEADVYAAARSRALIENPDLTSDFVPDSIRQLAQIAVDPAAVAHGSGIEGEMELLSWYLHSPVEMAGLDGKEYLRARPAVRTFRPTDPALRTVDPGSYSGKLGEKFRAALYEHDVALRDGFDHALPKALLSEYAVWEAAMHAQSLPLKVAYGAMSALLDAWIFTTLPLRLGFVVRNVVDNTAKMWVAGARDPRFYFLGAREPGKAVKSIFEADVNAMRYVLSLAGRYQQNPVLRYFDEIVETFWNHTSTVIQDIFKAHAIPVPERVIDEMRFHLPGRTDTTIGRAKERIWDLMAARPENFAKRGLYRATYYKAIQNGATEEEAFKAGWAAIDHTLFDYGKVTVLEDNFRQIFPFVQFWRKTTQFWIGESIDKPWLPLEFAQFEDRVRNDVHAGEPQWMRRYFDAAPITDALAKVPGLLWLMPALQDGAMTDPANFLSFNVLYKTFTDQNPNLPTDKKGLPFISGFIDAVNDWGLSMNPLFRKPLEMTGVLNYRAWQSVSPFTSLGDAFSKRFFGRDFNVEAYVTDWTIGPLADLLNLPAPDAVGKIGANFNQYVQQEMAGQAARGETVSRERAEDRIRKYFVVQTIIGFFGGVYLRRNTPSDFHLAKVADEIHQDGAAFASLSKQDQRAYRLLARKKLDPLAFDRYLNALPQIEAFYLMSGDTEAREQFKQNHPEIIPYVTRTYPTRAFSDRTAANLALLADQDAAIRMYSFVDDVEVSHDARKIAESYFVDQELRDFWAANDTPQQIRDKTLKAQYFAHMSRLNDAFHTIPETDYDARQSFLTEHPILGHWFNQNDSVSDDYRNVLNTANATLRDRYFQFLDAGSKPDWAGAHAFLKQFPFIFEFTKSESKVTFDGEWIGHGGKHGTGGTEHSRDYMAAKAGLDYYFSLSPDARRAFLAAGSPLARTVKSYFDKWGGGKAHTKSQHAKDYLTAKPALTIFFAMLKKDHDGAMRWLNGNTDTAKTVLAYFKKYAHPKGTSQHAVDFLKVKAPLAQYFALTDKAERRAFLDKHPEVSAYFKKWGHMTKAARNWSKGVGSDDPIINARLAFWKTYYSFSPEDRPKFVMENAEDSDVFIYGRLSDQERRASLHDYVIEAVKHGITRKAALYLRVKPLIDVYFTLAKDEQHLFLRANPDVASYLNEFAKPPSSGDKKLDSSLESYFAMPPHSSDRTDFLAQHPELQDYFDAHSSPADLAIRKVLDVYFAITDSYSKKRFAQLHPEIQLYFDKRKQERANELAQASPFDLADPRLASYFTHAEQFSAQPAYQMLLGLRRGVANNKVGDSIETRTERRPAKSSSPRA